MAGFGSSGGYSALASSIGGAVSTYYSVEQLKDQVKAMIKAFEKNKKILRGQLATAQNRVNVAITESNRDKLRTQMIARVAAGEAKGEVLVKAAQIGLAGKRAFKGTLKSIGRKEADIVSDANINAAIQKTNLINKYNDTALLAIQNLNQGKPSLTSSGGNAILAAFAGASTAFQSYQGLSRNQQQDIRNEFRTTGSGVTLAGETQAPNVDQTRQGGR